MKPPELSADALKKKHQLAHTPPGRLLLKYTIPATVATMVHATYNVVDRMFVGQAAGDKALAALAISFPVMMIMMAFGMMLGQGTGALMSISMGEEKHKRTELLLGQGLLMFIIISSIFLVFGMLFIEPLLNIFGATPDIMGLAKEYLSIILCGVLFHEISFGVNSFIRAEGNIKIAMYTSIIGCGLNIVLDWVFLMHLKWGVKGAAFATIISQAVSAAWVIWYYVSGSSIIKFHFRNLRIQPRLAFRVIQVGSPAMLLQLISCIMAALVNNCLKKHGDYTAIATAAVLFTVLSFIFMPLAGLCQGAQPIFGYNFGAANYDRVRKTLRISLIAATVIASLGYLISIMFPELIVAPFTGENSKLADTVPSAMNKFMMLMPLVGVVFVGSSYFQSVSKPLRAAILPLARQITFMVLLAILPMKYGLDGIWLCEPFSAGFAFTISAILLVYEQNHLKKRETLAIQPQEV